jgi:hypothetical protein
VQCRSLTEITWQRCEAEDRDTQMLEPGYLGTIEMIPIGRCAKSLHRLASLKAPRGCCLLVA